MEREQFTFYASFAKAARKIRKPTERCAFYDAVIDFALEGKTPEPGALPDVVEMAMELVAPVLSSARRKAEAGRSGGKSASEKTEAKQDLLAENRKQGETGSKPEANAKQGETGSKKEDKKEGKKEGENKKEDKCPPPTPSEHFSGDLLAAVNEWLAYKREKRQSYQPTGLASLFSQLRKAADAHGEEAVAQVIRNSMASGYTGITLDRLTNAAKRSPAYASSGPQKPLTAEAWDKVIDKI